MKKIAITGGRYGYISPSGVYAVKTPESEPFSVDDKEAARLVKRGVAKILGESGNSPKEGGNANSKGSSPAEVGNPSESENEALYEYDENTPAKELREIGKKCGLTFPVGMTKADMIAALNEYFGSDSGEDDGDDIDLDVEPPVV